MTAFQSSHQHTLKTHISCAGVGLHSGETVSMTLMPAEPGMGIVFKRTDVSAPVSYIHARHEYVTDTMLGTTITNEHGISVSTIEHLMAALWGAGVDNAYIELSAPEVPIMDGSSEPFSFLIDCAGLEKQALPRAYIRILKPVSVKEGQSSASLVPADHFKLSIEIDFTHRAIARQVAQYDFSEVSFKQALARARTFGFAHEVEKMRQHGLARGGSLANAIVVGDTGILNDEGLRFHDEFVRHKALDCVGDYFLCGARIIGESVTVRPGHCINNKLMRALMTDRSAWRYETQMETPIPFHIPVSTLVEAAA